VCCMMVLHDAHALCRIAGWGHTSGMLSQAYQDHVQQTHLGCKAGTAMQAERT